MRTIETSAGKLIGKVDRIARRVIWHLECEGCQALLPLDEAAFTGHRATLCECGWKTQPVAVAPATDGSRGAYIYFDYSTVFDTVPGAPCPAGAAA